MLKNVLATIAIVLFSSPAYSQQDPVVPVDDTSVIIFPDPLVPVNPPNPVPADSDLLLISNQTFVIQSGVEFEVAPSVEGRVTISYETGPLRMRGVFVDDPGRVQTRNFTAKFLAIVEPVDGKTGRIELIAFPFGYNKRSSYTRRAIDLGVAPRPPPAPPTPPVPPVPDVPPVPKPTGDFRVIMIWESSANNTDDTLRVFRSPEIIKYMTENCVLDPDRVAGWRKWDKDVPISPTESPKMASMWAKIKPLLGEVQLPQIAIAVGDDVKLEPLPKTVADTLELLKKYKEGR